LAYAPEWERLKVGLQTAVQLLGESSFLCQIITLTIGSITEMGGILEAVSGTRHLS